MSREWTPGDVAMVTGPRHLLYPMSKENATIPCRRERDVWYAIGLKNRGFTDREVVDVAPLDLVVIDPEDREQVERLRNLTLSCLRDHIGDYQTDGFTDGDLANAMQAALRSLVAPPEPEEPQGLGAVVEASCVHGDERKRWVRSHHGHWYAEAGEPDDYDSLRDVKVIHEGVAP